MPEIVISNTSPIFYLHRLRLLDLLAHPQPPIRQRQIHLPIAPMRLAQANGDHSKRVDSPCEDITSKDAAGFSIAPQFLGWAERPIDHHARVQVLKSGWHWGKLWRFLVCQ